MTVFTKLPIIAPGIGATIPQADVQLVSTAVGSLVETAAFRHWIFNKASNDNLTDLLSQSTLVAQNVYYPPANYGNYLTINTGAGRSLQTGIADSADATDTTFMVFRMPQENTGNVFLFGNLASSVGGSAYIRLDTSIVFNYRSGVDAPDATIPIATLDFAPNTWVFVAVARDFAGTDETIRVYIGQTVYEETATGVNYAPGPAPISIGNSSYSTNHQITDLDIAEFGYFNTALTAEELESLYIRRKQAMILNGLQVA